MTSAPIMPGTHPQRVKSNTITKEPQPFPMTDKGGKIIANKTLQKLIDLILIDDTYRYPICWICYTKPLNLTTLQK